MVPTPMYINCMPMEDDFLYIQYSIEIIIIYQDREDVEAAVDRREVHQIRGTHFRVDHRA